MAGRKVLIKRPGIGRSGLLFHPLCCRLPRILILLAAVQLSAIGLSAEEVETGLLRVGLAQMPMTLDPRYATDASSMRVQQLLHRGLMRIDQHFTAQADLAEKVKHPAPGQWIFHLRQDVYFHDGKKVTARDVVATLMAVLDPAKKSPLRAGLSAIDSIEAKDEYTVHIVLRHEDASFLFRLTIGILPARLARQEEMAKQIIGCGPYRLRSWHTNRLELQRAAKGEGPAIIRFHGVKDPVTRVLKLVRGELDFTQNDLPLHLIPFLQQQENLQIYTRPSTTFSYIGLNLEDPVLRDLRVRRALAMALDRTLLKQALFSDLPKPAETILPPDHWAYAALQPLKFDPRRAEQLLDEAGLKRQKETGIRFSLNYRTSTDPARLRLAVAVASMWKKIGVETHIESLEWGGFYARIKQGDFQVFSLSWVGITDPDIFRWVLHSSMLPPKGANRGHYRNADVDRWLDAALRVTDLSKRRLLYAKIQQQMHADLVYIPLWYEPLIAVTGPRINKDFKPASDGSFLPLTRISMPD